MLKLLNKSKSILNVGLFFALFKSIVLFGPILVANIISISDYARFETGISLANIAVIIVNLGVSAAIPYYILKKKDETLVSLAFLHSSVIAILFITLGCTFFYLDAGREWSFFCFATASFSCQRSLSSFLKTEGQPVKSSFFEAGFYFSIILGIIYFLIYEMLTLYILNICALVISLGMATSTVFYFTKSNSKNNLLGLIKLKELYCFSSRALVTGVYVVFIITFVKAFGLMFLTEKDYATYSLMFRVLTVSIIFYQLFSTIYFRDIYSKNSNKVEQLALITFIVIFIASIIIFVFFSFYPHFVFSIEKSELISSRAEVFLLVSLLMPLWAVTALLENYIARERLFSCFLKQVVASNLILLFITVVLHCLLEVTFYNFICLHLCLVLLLLLCQIRSLNNVGINLNKLLIIIILIVLLGMVYGSFSVK